MKDLNFWKVEKGTAVPLEYGTHNIADTSPYTPTGAYTTFRTYERFGVLRLSRHLDRLEETSRLAGFDIKLDRRELKKILVQLLSESTPEEKRIRVTIDLEKNPGTIYIAMETLSVPAAEKYRCGIICRTVEAHRENPKAKLSSFLGKAADLRGREHEAFDELLMVTAGGELLEGLSSNFYGVTGGTVYTAEEGVLSGTTRDFILKIAREAGIPVVLRPVRIEEIGNLDEAFISSTSRSILPIRSINGIAVKDPVPGPVTGRLMDRFSASIEHEIESLKG